MCELPVVATNIGGLPETVCDQVTGFIVEATDTADMTEKVKLILSDQELAENMGKAARIRYQSEYNYDHFIEKLNRIYSNVISIQ